ncbi:DUF3696 domain-containing protein [Streptosporangium sandarakinum]|uniref:Putative ATPase n=1 Tax=Streptosporangium sandarakinum TaxID=1260955 RepID=A0A852V205_9ACTN|nr:DUF3696 domain-containing protein [Streptosporangium sandarakinum]NYF43897.1 putative ATPase [Streptosporangium sandarakinum]
MIERLDVVNFKAFASASVPLGRFTLLSGLNSAGKSTVLQALALLRQSHAAGLLDGGSGSGLLLNGELVELGTGRDVLHENHVDTGGEGPQITLSVTEKGTVSSWTALYGQESDILHLQKQATDESLSLFGPGFQYLKADRLAPSVTYPRSHEIAVRRGFLGCRGEHTVNFLRHRQDDRLTSSCLQHPDALSMSLLDQTDAWMREICPGVNLQAATIEGTDLVRLGYRIDVAGLPTALSHRPTNVGFGLSYVLPIVVACLSATPGSVILLENPEAHLHPRGQTVMATLAAAAVAAGAQLIVESHSDHVLNGLRLAVKHGKLDGSAVRLLYFQREHDGVNIINPVIGSDGMISEWPPGFFDEWENSLDQLLG